MKITHLVLGVVLLGLIGTTSAQACQYCWGAGADGPDAARMAAKMHGGGSAGAFPLDNAINQFQPAAAPVALSTPPAAASIVTDAAGLRPATTLPAASPAPVRSVPVAAPPVVAKSAKSVHWADVGLLGLGAMGGLFCWRTRRITDAAR